MYCIRIDTGQKKKELRNDSSLHANFIYDNDCISDQGGNDGLFINKCIQRNVYSFWEITIRSLHHTVHSKLKSKQNTESDKIKMF